MSRRFRICMAKGGRGSFWQRKCGVAKVTPPIFIREVLNEYNMDSDIGTPCSIPFKAIGRKLAEWLWLATPLIFRNTTCFWPMALLWAALTSKRRLGHPNRLYFLSPECVCVRTPWVLAAKNFLLKTFGYGAFNQKFIFFQFWCQRPPA